MFDKNTKEKDKRDEDKDNFIQFFDLLLKIDMRKQPELYKPTPQKDA